MAAAGSVFHGRFIQKILLVISVFALTLIFVFSPSSTEEQREALVNVFKPSPEPSLPPRGIRTLTLPKKKKILAWTKIFQRDFLIYHKSKVITSKHAFSQCPVYKNCEWTIDKSEADSADALVFHFFPGDFKLNDLPGNRTPEQLWVHVNLEPPQRFQGEW